MAGEGRSQAPVIVSGTVPDEATRQAILNRAREVYGANRVVDQLGVGDVMAPANWSQYVQQVIAAPPVRHVGKGQLSIRGNNVNITGEVPSEAHRLQIAADVSALLNPTYLVRNGLSVATSDQSMLDAALANRIIEFQPGSADLRPEGQAILNEMARAMSQLGGKRVSVIGHTDASGDRATNIVLSEARAEAVRAYLTRAGVTAGSLVISGVGPDQPVATNATAEGRARNRRIEFRLTR
ncbi:MAG: OmpA family protein [Pseudomonadota bacterium]